MRICVLLIGFLLVVASPAAAQYDDCPSCFLGLFDNLEMTRSAGTPTGPIKVLYLGVLTDSSFTGLSGIEFSISGLATLLGGWEILHDPTVVIGSPARSEFGGTSGDGGINIAWADCIGTNQVLMKLTLVQPGTGWPSETFMEVQQRFPSTNPNLEFPLFTQCDAPSFTATRVTGGQYILSRDPACSFSAPQTIIGPVQQGGVAQQTFTITNTGGRVLTGTVLEDCADFFIVNPIYTLPAGAQTAIVIEFRPQVPGIQTCIVDIASGCATIEFLGTTTPVLSLANLHSDAQNLIGQEVTVEGQVFVPINYTLLGSTGWIQDGSDRGVRIAMATDSLLLDPSNIVRLTATVQFENSSVTLSNPSVVSLVQGQLPALSPRILALVAAASSAWDGTYIQVNGTVISRTLSALSTDYVTSDGLGTLVVSVSSGINAPLFVAGDFITARGPGGRIGDDFALFVTDPNDVFLQDEDCPGSRLVVGNARGAVGQILEVPVRLQVPITDVDAFGFELRYDDKVLRFLEANCCGLTADWTNCNARDLDDGLLVVGGFDSTPIPAGSDGEIVCITFEVLQCEAADQRTLEAVALVDDLVGLGTCAGIFTCIECPSDGDVNLDGNLTPGDALCAFEIFLAGQNVPRDCDIDGTCEVFQADVNCNGLVTPGDALDIFNRWLGGNSTPEDCFAAVPTATAQSVSDFRQPAEYSSALTTAANGNGFRFAVELSSSIGANRFAIPLQMRQSSTAVAFAAEITFSADLLRFNQLSVEPTTNWPALDALRIEPGRILVGGFNPVSAPVATDSAEWQTIAQLIFEGRRAHFNTVKWIEQRHSASQRVLPSTGISLARPFPNPLRSGRVDLRVAIPTGTAQWVELSIFDVAGRRVRSVHRGPLAAGYHDLYWDGRDERSNRVSSGIYVVRLKERSGVQYRKLVVLR